MLHLDSRMNWLKFDGQHLRSQCRRKSHLQPYLRILCDNFSLSVRRKSELWTEDHADMWKTLLSVDIPFPTFFLSVQLAVIPEDSDGML